MVYCQCIKNGCLCDNYPNKCSLCVDTSFFLPQKIKRKTEMRRQKKSSRMGAKFEEQNHVLNTSILNTASSMTPNSGAGKIKGDEQISGIINVMEELKTAVVPKLSRGSLSFTIKKEWLEKLDKEANAENKEFWYLKFRFLESDNNTYVVIDQDLIMSMVSTMVNDRTKAKLAIAEIEMLRAQYRQLQTQIVAKESEITALLKEREYLKLKDEIEKSS